MFLEELVEQHRVHSLVAHAVRLALLVTSYQIGINLFHLLGHQAELRHALRVKLFLIAKCDWFERENHFAGLVHWLDVVLETRRGCSCAEVTRRVYNNRYTCWNGCPTDASDICVHLSSYRSDSDCSG